MVWVALGPFATLSDVKGPSPPSMRGVVSLLTGGRADRQRARSPQPSVCGRLEAVGLAWRDESPLPSGCARAGAMRLGPRPSGSVGRVDVAQDPAVRPAPAAAGETAPLGGWIAGTAPNSLNHMVASTVALGSSLQAAKCPPGRFSPVDVSSSGYGGPVVATRSVLSQTMGHHRRGPRSEGRAQRRCVRAGERDPAIREPGRLRDSRLTPVRGVGTEVRGSSREDQAEPGPPTDVARSAASADRVA